MDLWISRVLPLKRFTGLGNINKTPFRQIRTIAYQHLTYHGKMEYNAGTFCALRGYALASQHIPFLTNILQHVILIFIYCNWLPLKTFISGVLT